MTSYQLASKARGGSKSGVEQGPQSKCCVVLVSYANGNHLAVRVYVITRKGETQN